MVRAEERRKRHGVDGNDTQFLIAHDICGLMLGLGLIRGEGEYAHICRAISYYKKEKPE